MKWCGRKMQDLEWRFGWGRKRAGDGMWSWKLDGQLQLELAAASSRDMRSPSALPSLFTLPSPIINTTLLRLYSSHLNIDLGSRIRRILQQLLFLTIEHYHFSRLIGRHNMNEMHCSLQTQKTTAIYNASSSMFNHHDGTCSAAMKTAIPCGCSYCL